MGRVCIGTCSGTPDAAMVRAAFTAHDIPVFINAEQHASMLGGLGGAFLTLGIYVDEEDAEDATALLRDLRGESTEEDGASREPGAEAADDASDDDDDDASASDSGIEVRIDRRRRTGVVMLLACCVTFGTASMYTGAWLLGIGLAGGEALSFRYLVVQPRVGAPMFVACVAIDLISSMWRVRRSRRVLPPVARARPRAR
jgi:hypothetical protein